MHMMNGDQALKRLQEILAQAKLERMYGTIELQIKDGDVELFRISKTELARPQGEKTRDYSKTYR
jgi:hypothetical protein